jgi:hypothetical protein
MQSYPHRLPKYDPKATNGEAYPDAWRYREAVRKNLSLPIPGQYPSKLVATHCTEGQVRTGTFAIALYTDTSADFRKAKPVLLASVIKEIEGQLRCKVISEILPQTDTTSYVDQKKIRRLTPWVLEIKITNKWGPHWLHDYDGPSCLTDEVDSSTRGHTNTMTERMNTVTLPHPTQTEANGKSKRYIYAFTLALPDKEKKVVLQGQKSGEMAREEKKATPHAMYITGLHLNCLPGKFLKEITPRVVARTHSSRMIAELKRPPLQK